MAIARSLVLSFSTMVLAPSHAIHDTPTYAAWVRTGLFALASGVGSRKLLTGLMPEWLIIAAGSVPLLFSAFCFAIDRDRRICNEPHGEDQEASERAQA